MKVEINNDRVEVLASKMILNGKSPVVYDHVFTISVNRTTGHIQPCSPHLSNGNHGDITVLSVEPEGYIIVDGVKKPAYFSLGGSWQQTTFLFVGKSECFGEGSDFKVRACELGPGKIVRVWD